MQMLWAIGALQPITVTSPAAANTFSSAASSKAPSRKLSTRPFAPDSSSSLDVAGGRVVTGIFSSAALQGQALASLPFKILAHSETMLGRLSSPGLALLGAAVVQAGLVPSRTWLDKYAGGGRCTCWKWKGQESQSGVISKILTWLQIWLWTKDL